MGEQTQIKIDDWYTADQAAAVIARRSHRVVKPEYLRSLARLGKVATVKLSTRVMLYSKADVDKYIVEDPGKKVARAMKARAKKAKAIA